MKKNPYEILGLSPNATEDEIKKRFRDLSKECFPDLYPGDIEKEERMKEISAAFSTLKKNNFKMSYSTEALDFEKSKAIEHIDNLRYLTFGDRIIFKKNIDESKNVEEIKKILEAAEAKNSFNRLKDDMINKLAYLKFMSSESKKNYLNLFATCSNEEQLKKMYDEAVKENEKIKAIQTLKNRIAESITSIKKLNFISQEDILKYIKEVENCENIENIDFILNAVINQNASSKKIIEDYRKLKIEEIKANSLLNQSSKEALIEIINKCKSKEEIDQTINFAINSRQFFIMYKGLPLDGKKVYLDKILEDEESFKYMKEALHKKETTSKSETEFDPIKVLNHLDKMLGGSEYVKIDINNSKKIIDIINGKERNFNF